MWGFVMCAVFSWATDSIWTSATVSCRPCTKYFRPTNLMMFHIEIYMTRKIS